MRPVTIVLVAGSIAAAAAAAATRVMTPATTAGADFRVVCASASVLEAGGNPYDGRTLDPVTTSTLPMTYPPLVARVVSPACGRVPSLWLVLATAAAAIVLIARIPGASSYALILLAVVAGFGAFPWLVVTGNIAMFEGMAGAVAVAALVRGRERVFGAALAAAGFIKLMPLGLVVVAFAYWRSAKAWRAVAAAMAVFGALHVTSLAIDPDAARQYWSAIGSGFGGYAEAELRFGSEANPSHFSFLPILSDHIGAGRTAGFAAAALITLAAGAVWYRAWRRHTAARARFWLAALALVGLVAAYPRFKPYSLFLLTPLLALALSEARGRARDALIVLACLLPNIALLALTMLATRPPVPVPVVFLLQYAQWLCVALVVAAALWMAVKKETARILSNAGR